MLIKKWGQNFVITLSSIWIFSGCHQWYIFINCIEILVEIVKTVWAAVCEQQCVLRSVLSAPCAAPLDSTRGWKKFALVDVLHTVPVTEFRVWRTTCHGSRLEPAPLRDQCRSAPWTRCLRPCERGAVGRFAPRQSYGLHPVCDRQRSPGRTGRHLPKTVARSPSGTRSGSRPDQAAPGSTRTLPSHCPLRHRSVWHASKQTRAAHAQPGPKTLRKTLLFRFLRF